MTPGRNLAEQFKLEEVPDLEPLFNIAPIQTVGIIRLNAETLQRRLALVKWKLIPSWAQDLLTPSSLDLGVISELGVLVRGKVSGNCTRPSDVESEAEFV